MDEKLINVVTKIIKDCNLGEGPISIGTEEDQRLVIPTEDKKLRFKKVFRDINGVRIVKILQEPSLKVSANTKEEDNYYVLLIGDDKGVWPCYN